MHILTSTGTVLVLRVAVEDVGRAIGGVALTNGVGLKVDVAHVSNSELDDGRRQMTYTIAIGTLCEDALSGSSTCAEGQGFTASASAVVDRAGLSSRLLGSPGRLTDVDSASSDCASQSSNGDDGRKKHCTRR